MTERSSPDIVERLRERWMECSRASFDSVDAGLSANLLDETIDEIERLRASVKSDNAQAAQGDPVAWRYCHKGQGDWCMLKDGQDPTKWLATFNGEYEIQPLYAAQPQEATGTGDLVNRLLAAPVTLKTGQEAVAVIAELEADNKRLRAQPQTASKISFMEAMNMVERGFDTWKDKPHNAKWYSRIDGTPIPNDLKVNIAEAIRDYPLSRPQRPEGGK